MTRVTTYQDCEEFLKKCKVFWMRNGDSEKVAEAKAFWWDQIECWDFDKSWNAEKERFAMDFRGYKRGDPIPDESVVEKGEC